MKFKPRKINHSGTGEIPADEPRRYVIESLDGSHELMILNWDSAEAMEDCDQILFAGVEADEVCRILNALDPDLGTVEGDR